jgi:hypothetical protein
MWSRFSSAVMVGGDEVGADVVQLSVVFAVLNGATR